MSTIVVQGVTHGVHYTIVNIWFWVFDGTLKLIPMPWVSADVEIIFTANEEALRFI